MAASKPAGSPIPMDEHWSAILRGDRFAAFAPRLGRRVFALFPGRPRCKVCNAPYGGPVTWPFRALGYRPSKRTPHVCARCLEWAPEGGAIVPISVLFADVRNYTTLTRLLSPHEVPALLNRFYDVASRVLLKQEGVLGQIAGDQVMGLFVPGLSGRDYQSKAVAAAAGLLDAGGHRTTGRPWAAEFTAECSRPAPTWSGRANRRTSFWSSSVVLSVLRARRVTAGSLCFGSYQPETPSASLACSTPLGSAPRTPSPSNRRAASF